ncbi:MAG TPA: ABC transporter permease subunit [Streptosporangiaceae bacterium]|nr:ABC transporter permease subunit [Streptosporangiaceae bacterium]
MNLELINPIVFRLTVRATLSRKRTLIFAITPFILIGVSALLSWRARSPVWPPEFLGDFGFTVVVPLTALIIGTSVLGAEIDDASVISLLGTPVRRSAVVLTKFAAAVLLTAAFAAVGEYLATAIATGPGSSLALGLLAGAVVASVVYNALFVLLSVLTTRAIALGLLYLLVWEGLLGNLVGGVRLLSVDQYALGVANAVADSQPLHAHLGITTALVMGAVVTCVALALASRRLAAFSLKGDAV